MDLGCNLVTQENLIQTALTQLNMKRPFSKQGHIIKYWRAELELSFRSHSSTLWEWHTDELLAPH